MDNENMDYAEKNFVFPMRIFFFSLRQQVIGRLVTDYQIYLIQH
jgi:hypothetical protein